MNVEIERAMHAEIETLRDALRELYRAVEAKADIGKRREITVSPRMEDALKEARKALRMREGEQ